MSKLSVNEIIMKLNDNFDVIITTTMKNGVEKTSVSLNTNDSIKPTVYIEDYLNNDDENNALNIAQKIIETLIRATEKGLPEDIDINRLTNLNYIKENVIITFEKSNDIIDSDYLKKLGIGNINITLRVLIKKDNNECMSFKINKELLKYHNIDINEIVEIALENTYKYHCVKTMYDTLVEINPNIEIINNIESMNMYVLTNDSKVDGATAMLNTTLLDGLCKMMKTPSIAIIPSSRHEVLVINATDIEIDYIKDMITQVNENEVAPEDYLSDNLYIYNTETGLYTTY